MKLTLIVCASVLMCAPVEAATHTLLPGQTLHANFTVDPSTFPINPATGLPRVPDILLVHYRNFHGSGSGAESTVRIYDGSTLLASQTTGLGAPTWFRSPASLFTVGVPMNFTSIQSGTIQGRIEVEISKGEFTFESVFTVLGEASSSGGFVAFGPIDRDSIISPECLVNLSFANQTLTMRFTIGSSIPTRWNVWLSAQNTTTSMWSIDIPIVDPAVEFSLPFTGFPAVGNVGVLTTLVTNSDGIVCSSWDTTNTN
jgi:hypothetical protein